MLLRIVSKIPFVVMTGFSFLLFGITIIYWNFKPDVNFLLTKQDVVFNPVWRSAFYIHIFGGMLAIALGPLQFIKFLRRKYLEAHRLIGKTYVIAILFLAAPTGLYMAFYANGGFYASLGFFLMSILWFYTTFMAVKTIRQKKIDEHINWMVRSYALTFAAVTLRILVPLFSFTTEMESHTIEISTAWMSWLVNLVAAEILIRSKLKSLQL
ncbi:MAG: hypothetical protein K0S32_1595 [Bacteroidetes bacterium]|nr:hypothetical protein [Bacteroidota bacterium]